MLRTMAEPLGEVCSVTRRLLRRGLGLQTSRRVNVFFPTKGRILFEQAMNFKIYNYVKRNGKTIFFVCSRDTSLEALKTEPETDMARLR